MIRVLFVITTVLIVSCNGASDQPEKGKEYWIIGTVTAKAWGTDTIFYHDCYCNLIKSKIIINYVYFGGVEGGSLTASLSRDSTNVTLSYLNLDFRTFSYETKEVTINQSNPKLGETISGEIVLKGQSKSREQETYDFNLKGNFRCVLRDSTYDGNAFYNDYLDHYDSLKMLEIRRVAHINPDSVLELQLGYKNFYLMKDYIHSFKNLQSLSLSKFPAIDNKIISNFKLLKELRIAGDSLRQIPKNIGELRDLELLSVAGPVTDVPESLYTLTKLKELDLGATNIAEISSRVKDLKDLEKLNIGYTEITRIPMEIFGLDKLADLTLPDTLIPFKVRNLNFKSLKILSISYDFLMYNKADIDKFKDLEWLYPSFVYQTHEEFMTEHRAKLQWLEERLPKVRISEVTYIND